MQLIIFNELCARVHMSLAESVNSWKCGKAHYSIWCVCVCVSPLIGLQLSTPKQSSDVFRINEFIVHVWKKVTSPLL